MLKTIARILRYLRPYRRNLSYASASMLGFVVFNMTTVVLIIPFINVLFDPKKPEFKPAPPFSLDTFKEWALTGINNLLASATPSQSLKALCALIVLSFVMKNVFHYLQSWFMAPAEHGIIRDLRQQLYEHMTTLSMSYFSEEKKGTLISRIVNDVKVVNDSAIAVVNSIFRDPPQILTYTVILFLIDWQLTMLVFVLLPATGWFLAKVAQSLRRESSRLQTAMADITAALDEGLANMRIIKAFRTERQETERFKTHNERYFRTFVSIMRRSEMTAPITEVVSVLVVVVILWFLGESILTGKSGMTSGVFVAYIFAMLQMMQPLKFFGQMIGSVSQGVAGAQRVFSVLDIPARISDAPGARDIAAFRHKIEFRDVHFRYDTGEEILSGVSIEIAAGSAAAIVGPSGVGKSTLVDLVPRFYDVTGGAILIDGTDIRELTLTSLRGLMGIVTQETFLFNAPIRENIAYGSPGSSFEQIVEAAKAANAHDFIVETADGYDTVIGDRGVKLSGGQRQRLSIARAILKNPPILILDEATSALDTESELLVQEAIQHLMDGRTSIVIAHRLSTIQRADVIYALEGGRVAERGSHADLMRNDSGLYKRLYDLQFKL
ncbi:MAG: ABC transporter ATP-binding protein [Ignavibacteria bacterium]|nr:ABC transporter ATP-binding protein [Ignavibacteria bacterium]